MIRVYGISVGNGSYARVTAGVCGALERLGLLSGFVPVDALDEWAEYEGATAPVSVLIGPQTRRIVELPSMLGAHDRRLLLLPLNSSWAPREMLMFAEPGGGHPWPLVTGFLTPSRWSAGWLTTLTSAPVQVWRHGLEPAFRPDLGAAGDRVAEWHGSEELRVLHMTSTERARKGTAQLVRAWAKMKGWGKLPYKAELHVVMPGLPDPEGELFEVLDAMPKLHRESVRLLPNQNLSPEDMAAFLQKYHIIAQPSRGEGFGMVPLEALACGVPVVATACAGHSEYLSLGTPGTSIVPHGADAAIDDGPGARAPSVLTEDVQAALARAIESWPRLKLAAMESAGLYQAKWSWDAVMTAWAKKEGWVQ